VKPNAWTRRGGNKFSDRKPASYGSTVRRAAWLTAMHTEATAWQTAKTAWLILPLPDHLHLPFPFSFLQNQKELYTDILTCIPSHI